MSGRQINTSHNAILSEWQSAACFPQWSTHNIDFLYFWFLWKHVDRYGAQLTGELKAWAHLSDTGPVEAEVQLYHVSTLIHCSISLVTAPEVSRAKHDNHHHSLLNIMPRR